KRVKRKRVLTKIEARDRWFLLWFIVTTGCRRIPWNEFYKNAKKKPSLFPLIPDMPCCDNCHPDRFLVPTIQLTDPNQLQAPGRTHKSSEELQNAIKTKLRVLREEIVQRAYPNQYIITGKVILQDDVINSLADHARLITSVEVIKKRVRWHWTDTYGTAVVDAIAEVLQDYPDTRQIEQEKRERERAEKVLQGMKKQEFQDKLKKLSATCFDAVESVTRPGHE
ncbi:hypothetical protein K435DRAFT_577784, partial [Dendrothele bispora CBS 962.96]